MQICFRLLIDHCIFSEFENNYYLLLIVLNNSIIVNIKYTAFLLIYNPGNMVDLRHVKQLDL